MTTLVGTERKLRKITPEEVRLQTASEKNRQRWCGRDVARQVVPGERAAATAVYRGPAVMWSMPIVGGFWSRDPRAGGVHQYKCSRNGREFAACKHLC